MYFHCEDAFFTEKLHLPLRARAASLAKKNKEKRQMPLRARAAASELRSAAARGGELDGPRVHIPGGLVLGCMEAKFCKKICV